MENRKCVACGTEISENAVFCETCGMKQPEPDRYGSSCAYCGAELVPESAFCANCGMRTEGRAADPEVPKDAGARKTEKIKPIVLAGVTWLLSTVMLVMAFFPVATYNFSDLAGLEGFELSFSPVDHVVLLFDSMKSLDDEDLAESDLVEEMEELGEDFSAEIYGQSIAEYDDMDRDAQKMFEELMFLTLRLAMSSEEADGSMGPFLATATVLSLLYILAALALFVVSLFYLLSAIGLLGKKKTQGLKNATLALLFALPMLLLARWVAENVLWSPTGNSDLTATSVIVLVLSVLAFVMYVVFEALGGARYTTRVLVPRLISSVLAVLLIGAVFMPAVSVKIKEQFEGRTTKKEAVVSLPPALLGSLLVGDSDGEMYDEMQTLQDSEEYAEELEYAFDFSYYTRKDVEKGVANVDVFYAMFVIGAPYGFHGFSWAFAQVALLMTLIVLMAAAILWQNALYFAGGKPSAVFLMILKSVAFVLTLAALVLVIVFVILLSYYLDNDLPDGARFSIAIGAGIIMAAVVALANLFVPSRVREKCVCACDAQTDEAV